jgi:hypothetical protein
MTTDTNTSVARAARWRPSPFLQASALLHGGAAALTLAQPTDWPWALGAVAVNQLLLGGAGLWPRSNWLGPNWTHLPAAAAARCEVAITIDDGPEHDGHPASAWTCARPLTVRSATFFCHRPAHRG